MAEPEPVTAREPQEKPAATQSPVHQGQDFSNKIIINESDLYSLILSSKLPSVNSR